MFAGLSGLESLHLNDNELSRLPPSIGSLLGLTELHLQYNKLQRLPSDLGQLPALRRLELEGNPLHPAQLLHLAAESAAAASDLDLVKFRQLLMLQREAGLHSTASGDSSRPLSAASGSMAATSAAAGSGTGAGSALGRAVNGMGDRSSPSRADASRMPPDVLILGHNGDAGRSFQQVRARPTQ